MRPTIQREGRSWVVRLTRDGTFHAAHGTWERAMNRADRITTHPARARATRDLARAKAALDRMEARTNGNA